MFSIMVYPSGQSWRVVFQGKGGAFAIDGVTKADVARIIARATNGMRPA